ncbi:uncharacterized protein ASPGLDRAFT_52045 [Aspergillus glaucus CBS 516.65]|uniref:Uncharacterized protein n=1 Tax=Aspergillus glaucus CBS 516.65 TaxID=1160497 RepID=A0A1L9V868_ASPGL|nr:hypothetical protein ASPGLDRAFT_52045 [Aspergillus glaucus CBS 516.65]OJJ80124.1 hypothetical protein ASPGLDRAFT_52045 [Aspergillus glaucus CBS 516.65]
MAPVTQVPTPQTIQHDSHQQADSMDIDDHTMPTPGDYPVDEMTTQGGFPDDTPSTLIQGGDQSSPQPQEQDFHQAKALERPQVSERPEQSTQAAQRPAKKSSHDLIAELWRRLEQKDEEMSELCQAQMNANTSSTDSRLADQLSKLFEQKDSQSMLDREEQRLRQLAQTYW